MANLVSRLAAGSLIAISPFLTSCTQEELLVGDIATAAIGTGADLSGGRDAAKLAYVAWNANAVVNRFADRQTEIEAAAAGSQDINVNVNNYPNGANQTYSQPQPQASGEIYYNQMKVDLNKVRNGQRGIQINVPVRIANNLGDEAMLVAYFLENNGNGYQPLQDNVDSLYMASGTREISSYNEGDLTPTSNDQTKNATIFIPNTQLHRSNGKHEMAFQLVLFKTPKTNPVMLNHTGFYNFQYSQ